MREYYSKGIKYQISDTLYRVLRSIDRAGQYYRKTHRQASFVVDSNAGRADFVCPHEVSLEVLYENAMESILPKTMSTEDVYALRARNIRLYDAISQLSEMDQHIVIAVYFFGKRQTEIAEHFGLTQPAIHYRLKNSLNQLKSILS